VAAFEEQQSGDSYDPFSDQVGASTDQAEVPEVAGGDLESSISDPSDGALLAVRWVIEQALRDGWALAEVIDAVDEAIRDSEGWS
jgi:hypothetical protein